MFGVVTKNIPYVLKFIRLKNAANFVYLNGTGQLAALFKLMGTLEIVVKVLAALVFAFKPNLT